MLVGRAESSVPLFFAPVAIAALKKFDVGPAMPAFFRLALTTMAVKSLLPNFPHNPLAWIIKEDSASRVNLAKQIGQSSEKRGPLTYQKGAEEDGSRCDARFSSGVDWRRIDTLLF